MYFNTQCSSRFPATVEVVIENELDLDLVKRIAGLTKTVPGALADRANSKARSVDFLEGLSDAVASI